MIVTDSKNVVECALEDIRCYREHGVDLNPYSTPWARQSWQNSFDEKLLGMLDYPDCYQRGKTTKELLASKVKKS